MNIMSFPYKNPITSLQVGTTQSVPQSNTYGLGYSVNNIGGYMEVYSLNDLIYTIPTGTTGSIEYSGNTIPIEFTKGDGNPWSRDVLTLGSDNISSGNIAGAISSGLGGLGGAIGGNTGNIIGQVGNIASAGASGNIAGALGGLGGLIGGDTGNVLGRVGTAFGATSNIGSNFQMSSPISTSGFSGIYECYLLFSIFNLQEKH